YAAVSGSWARWAPTISSTSSESACRPTTNGKRAGSPAERDQRADARNPLIRLLTTEEFVLQSAHASTISESASRATIVLGSVSSGLIATALTAQVTRIGTTFYVLALTVLPTLVVLGRFSDVRIVQTGIEDVACALAIRRLR